MLEIMYTRKFVLIRAVRKPYTLDSGSMLRCTKCMDSSSRSILSNNNSPRSGQCGAARPFIPSYEWPDQHSRSQHGHSCRVHTPFIQRYEWPSTAIHTPCPAANRAKASKTRPGTAEEYIITNAHTFQANAQTPLRRTLTLAAKAAQMRDACPAQAKRARIPGVSTSCAQTVSRTCPSAALTGSR